MGNVNRDGILRKNQNQMTMIKDSATETGDSVERLTGRPDTTEEGIIEPEDTRQNHNHHLNHSSLLCRNSKAHSNFQETKVVKPVFEKKNKVGRLTLHGLKTYRRAIVAKRMLSCT